MIKFIQSPHGIGWAYLKGDTANLAPAVEADLVETGFAEYVESEQSAEPIEIASAKPKAQKRVTK